MLVKCSLCGREEEITKIHKDYQRLASKPESPYICFKCNNYVKISTNKEIRNDRKLL